MTRYADWDSRLAAMLAECRALSFEFGVWDCFQFARAGVLAMSGCDIAAQFAPYGSRFGYLRQIRRYCNSFSLLAFADTLMASLGMAQVAPGFARRGDLAMAGRPEAFGIVSLKGRTILMLTETGEVAELPLAQAIRIWRV